MKDKLKKLFIRRPLGDYILYILGLLGIVVIDQVTKLLAVTYLEPIDTLPIIEGVIHLTYLENRGAAFGMLAGAPWVFNTFSVIAIIAILCYLFLGQAETKLYSIPLVMIAGGGIGNMIDRAALGYVVDFIDFRLINFAVFNGADSFVSVGAGLLILALVLDIVGEARALKSTPVSGEDVTTHNDTTVHDDGEDKPVDDDKDSANQEADAPEDSEGDE